MEGIEHAEPGSYLAGTPVFVHYIVGRLPLVALMIGFIRTHPIKAKGLHHVSSLSFDFRILVGGLETAAVQL